MKKISDKDAKKKQQKITARDIDELVAFLPKLKVLEGRFLERWDWGTPREDGVLNLPIPQYSSAVHGFFHCASKACWRDYEYLSNDPGFMLNNPERIKAASLNEIRSMLTYMVRGERFCDGFWSGVLKSGIVFFILERLAELRGSVK